MTVAENSLQHFAEAIQVTAAELATTALGLSSCRFSKNEAPWPQDPHGAYISLVGAESFMIGMVAAEGDCQLLARALLGMEADEENLGCEDLADAIGEIINILAGMAKTLLEKRLGVLKLGLPSVIVGRLLSGSRREQVVLQASMDGIQVSFLAIGEGCSQDAPGL